MPRRVYHGDERDHCLNCQHSLAYCELRVKECRYNEATESSPNARHKTDYVRDFEGVEEPLMDHWNFGYN